MLLCGDAAVWWPDVKASIPSWCDAISALRDAFGDRRPLLRIYAQLFKRGQQNDERTGDLSEKVQLDMIYGIVSRRVEERIRRDEVSSFDVLLQRARQIEDATDELRYEHDASRPTGELARKPYESTTGTGRTRPPPAVAARTAACAPSGAAPGHEPATQPPLVPGTPCVHDSVERKRCSKSSYCLFFGHERNQFCKLDSKEGDQFYTNLSKNRTHSKSSESAVKSDQSFYCVDYRRLNVIAKADSYPMPSIEELFQSMKRDRFMNTLDLRFSYWQLHVRECDIDNTAFVCPLGNFRFKRMLCGLR